jgi:uncharacterized OsmC-like protein
LNEEQRRQPGCPARQAVVIQRGQATSSHTPPHTLSIRHHIGFTPTVGGVSSGTLRQLSRVWKRGFIMTATVVNNGVNVQALLDAREALKGAPEAAKFTWRASCKWQNGTHSKTKIQSFFGLGQEQSHKTESSLGADHPEIFASEDHAITPIEYVLVGLASCLTAGVAAVAQNRGIQLRSVESNLEGKMDIRGILGIDSDVRNGYDDIKVTFKIDADASKDDIEALVAQSQKRSAVYDVITNPVNVTVQVV